MKISRLEKKKQKTEDSITKDVRNHFRVPK